MPTAAPTRHSRRFNEILLLECSLALTLSACCLVFLLSRGRPPGTIPVRQMTFAEPAPFQVVPQVQREQTKPVFEQPAAVQPPAPVSTELPLIEPEPLPEPVLPAAIRIPPPLPMPEVSEPVPFFSVEIRPELLGGAEALYRLVDYPELARRAGVEGLAQIEFVVGKDGIPRELRILEEQPAKLGFGEAAIEALKQVRFTPGMQRDRLVAVRMQQTLRFRLGR